MGGGGVQSMQQKIKKGIVVGLGWGGEERESVISSLKRSHSSQACNGLALNPAKVFPLGE